MRKGFAVAALICGIFGLIVGLNEWFLNQYVLPLVDWQGPLQALANLSWLLETLLIGLAVIFLAIGLMLEPKLEEDEFLHDETQNNPPPLPKNQTEPLDLPLS